MSVDSVRMGQYYAPATPVGKFCRRTLKDASKHPFKIFSAWIKTRRFFALPGRAYRSNSLVMGIATARMGVMNWSHTVQASTK